MLEHPEEVGDDKRQSYVSLAERLGVKAPVPRTPMVLEGISSVVGRKWSPVKSQINLMSSDS